jgi:hypothetical protein
MILASDYPFLDIMGTMIVFFLWLIWVWMLVAILTDVFRRSDLSGWGKAGWSLLLIVAPFLGAFIYLIAHGKDMGERRVRDAAAAQQRYDEHISSVAAASGPAAEIEKASRLRESGAIDDSEFAEIKRKALAM